MVRRDRSISATIENVLVCIAAVAVGILVVKTVIECRLYGIPFAVKLSKNAIAFAMDTIVMSAGMVFAQRAPIVRAIHNARQKIQQGV